MITYVVPTMWFYEPFVGYLKDLVDCPYIGEIILINNRRDVTPAEPWLLNSKIRMFAPENNIGVNPAWNVGVANATHDVVCVANDDILVDFKLFQKIEPIMQSADAGIAGLSAGEEIHHQVPLTTGNIDIEPWPHQTSQTHSRFGFGCLYFVNKNNWVPIPQGLLIYYGDDWVIETQILNKRSNYIINNCLHHGERAVTCSKLNNVDEILTRERAIYFAEIENYKQNLNASGIPDEVV